jgi:hypothetical protein
MTKLCPYCSEEIKEDAIKCRHCGEWLNKSKPSDLINKIGKFFKSNINSLKERQKEREIKQFSHLFPPTFDKAFTYKNIQLYASYLKVDDLRIELDEIFSLTYFSSSNSINGVSPNTNFHFIIGYSKYDRVSLYPQNQKEIIVAKGSFFNLTQRKDIERIQFLLTLLQSMTIKYRLMRFFNELRTKGSFNYINAAEFYSNGDIQDKNGQRANIKVAYDNQLISFGSKFSGFRHSSYNPYSFVVYPTHGLKIKILGYELNSKIEIQTIWNKDCLEQLINVIIQDGKIL